MGKFDDIKADVEEHGIVELELQQLRDAHGVKRLGGNVLAEIGQALQAEGLAYFPEWIIEANAQPRQNQTVRLCLADTSSLIFKVVRAVQAPSDAGDKTLLSLAGEAGAARAEEVEDRLARVRAAIEDAMEILKEEDVNEDA